MPNENLGNLNVKIGLEDLAAPALKQAEQNMRNFQAVGESAAAGIGSAFQRMAGVLGVSLSIGGLVAFLDRVKDNVIELGHLSDKTGIAIHTLGGLQLLAKETGTNFESLSTSMVRLERAQELAISGGQQQIDAFKRIGLSVDQIKSLKPEELFYATGKAIAATGSQSKVAAASFTLLGRGGAESLSLFKQYGNELPSVIQKSADLANIFDADRVAAEKLQKQEADLSAQLNAAALPALSLAVKVVAQLTIDFFAATAAIKQTGYELVATVKNIDAFRKAGEEFNKLQFGKASADAKVALKEIEANNVKAADESDKAWTKAYQAIGKLTAALNLPAFHKVDAEPPGPGLKKPDKFVDLSIERNRKLAELDALMLKANETAVGEWEKEDEQFRVEIVKAWEGANSPDALVAAHGQAALEALLAARERAFNAFMDREAKKISAVIGKMASDKAPDLVAAKVVLPTLAKQPVFNDDLEKRIKTIQTLTGGLTQSFDDLFRGIASGTRNLSDVFKGMADSVVAALSRIIAKMLVVAITEKLIQAFTGAVMNTNIGASGPSNLQGGGIGSGANFYPPLTTPHAAGGPVIPGVPYLVGERGPEPVIFGQRGTMYPNGALGGATVVNKINIINQSSQKVDAYASKPRVDVEGTVTDVILRDAEQRGPIFTLYGGR